VGDSGADRHLRRYRPQVHVASVTSGLLLFQLT
jgi:hypothetical protein